MNTCKLSLYVFWDKYGLVRNYVLFYLKELTKVSSKVIVIVNGDILSESLIQLKKIGCEVIVRDNHGLDFGAWQDALQYIGCDTLSKYDELILCNCTCYGPVYPFSELFSVMDTKQCDFWGISMHPENKSVCFVVGDNNTVIHKHIQSYFMVIKNNILISDCFKNWWTNLRQYDDYKYEVGYHEIQFTKYLEDNGFRCSCLIDNSKYLDEKNLTNILFLYSEQILIEDRNPLVKRKLFSEYLFFLHHSIVRASKLVFDYIEHSTTYPTNYIWEDLLATQKLSDITKILDLNYIVPNMPVHRSTKRIAIICYISSICSIHILIKYIVNIPNGSDLIIIASNNEYIEKFKDVLATKVEIPFKNIEYRICDTNTNKYSANLIVCKDVFKKYDYICSVNNASDCYCNTLASQEQFFYENFECCLNSKNYVDNLLRLFDLHPELGLIVPPIPYYGPFLKCKSNSAHDVEILKKYFNQLNITTPFDINVVRAIGGCFWVKSEAMITLLNKKWSNYDFIFNENKSCSMYFFESLFALAAQNDGFYTITSLPIDFASCYYKNIVFGNELYSKLLSKGYDLNSNDIIEIFYLLQNSSNTEKNRTGRKKMKYYKYKILNICTFGLIKKFKKRYKSLSLWHMICS